MFNLSKKLLLIDFKFLVIFFVLALFSNLTFASPGDVAKDKREKNSYKMVCKKYKVKRVNKSKGSPGNLVKYYMKGFKNLEKAQDKGTIIYNLGQGSPAEYILVCPNGKITKEKE